MWLEITKTFDDMIGLRQLLYMCKAEKTHLNDSFEIRGLYFNEQLQTYCQRKELNVCCFSKEQ